MARKSRVGEVVCTCRAYRFPHRLTSGRCRGMDFIEEFFEANAWGECRACSLVVLDCGLECAVINGQEDWYECPALQEHLDRNEVPVPLKFKRKSWS